MICQFKEAWWRHEPNCTAAATCTLELTINAGVRSRLALCDTHKEAAFLNAAFAAVDLSHTDEAVHDSSS